MDKILGNRKKFGRCDVQGHGSKCSASGEMQGTPITKAEDKREWAKDAIEEINSMSSEEFEDFIVNCD